MPNCEAMDKSSFILAQFGWDWVVSLFLVRAVVVAQVVASWTMDQEVASSHLEAKLLFLSSSMGPLRRRNSTTFFKKQCQAVQHGPKHFSTTQSSPFVSSLGSGGSTAVDRVPSENEGVGSNLYLELCFLSAAIGQRPRNYLSCCCCSCCPSPFVSFPH